MFGDGGLKTRLYKIEPNYYNIKKITNLTSDREHPLYLKRFYDVNDRVETNLPENTKKHYSTFHKLNSEQKLKEIMSSGLNNLKYTILERKMVHDLVEVIKVEI